MSADIGEGRKSGYGFETALGFQRAGMYRYFGRQEAWDARLIILVGYVGDVLCSEGCLAVLLDELSREWASRGLMVLCRHGRR